MSYDFLKRIMVLSLSMATFAAFNCYADSSQIGLLPNKTVAPSSTTTYGYILATGYATGGNGSPPPQQGGSWQIGGDASDFALFMTTPNNQQCAPGTFPNVILNLISAIAYTGHIVNIRLVPISFPQWVDFSFLGSRIVGYSMRVHMYVDCSGDNCGTNTGFQWTLMCLPVSQYQNSSINCVPGTSGC